MVNLSAIPPKPHKNDLCVYYFHELSKSHLLREPLKEVRSYVVKIGVIEYDESYGTEIGKEVATVERLTNRTESVLLGSGGCTQDGRFW